MPLFEHADITNTGTDDTWQSLDARGKWKATLEQVSPDPTGAYLLNKRRKGTTSTYAIELVGTPYTLTQATPEVVLYTTGQEELQIVRSASGTVPDASNVSVELVDRC